MKIKSIRKLGKRRTFSIEMKGVQHNYITDSSNVVHKNSHATAYIIIAHRCLWLKTHFPAEWWASVMSYCHTEKLNRYMSVARTEGVEFGQIHCDNLTENFTVVGSKVTPGFTSIKGIGKSAVDICGCGPYDSVDDFVEKHGKNCTILERLIKLGAFNEKHGNSKAIWMWYLYEHSSGKNITALKRIIRRVYCWDIEDIEKERERVKENYFKEHPGRKKVPAKITNWRPSIPLEQPKLDKTIFEEKIKLNGEIRYIDETFFDDLADNIDNLELDVEQNDEDVKIANKISITVDHVIRLFHNDFSLEELLEFEKEYLGYYWHSPLDIYEHEGHTISEAKRSDILEAVIQEVETRQGKSGEYIQLTVTDGVEIARVMVWSDDVLNNGEEIFKEGLGVKMRVVWKETYRSFNLKNNTIIMPLTRKEQPNIDDVVYEEVVECC